MKFPKVLNTAGIPKVHAAEIKVSNAKNHGCSGYIGMIPTQLCRNYFINYDSRIPFKQPVEWDV